MVVLMVVVVNKELISRPILVPHAFLLHHYTYVYLLNTHVQRIAILRQHVPSYYAVDLLTAYRWKDRHRSLHLDPHCICRGESAHSSSCLILFKRFLPSHLLSIHKKYVQSTLHYRQPFFILYVYSR
jgi:hypothetical protein